MILYFKKRKNRTFEGFGIVNHRSFAIPTLKNAKFSAVLNSLLTVSISDLKLQMIDAKEGTNMLFFLP